MLAVAPPYPSGSLGAVPEFLLDSDSSVVLSLLDSIRRRISSSRRHTCRNSLWASALAFLT